MQLIKITERVIKKTFVTDLTIQIHRNIYIYIYNLLE